MKIALFESSDMFRKVIRSTVVGEFEWFEHSDFTEKAQYELESQHFDAIVTSKELETSDFRKVVDFVRAKAVNQEAPVYLLSSDQSSKFLNSAFDCGVTDIFAKQELSQLSETFRNTLSYTNSVQGAELLLVEDSETVANYYAKVFREMHFKVTIAATCQEAQDIFERQAIELIIVDLHLESGDVGHRIIRHVRRGKTRLTRFVPIMVLSSSVLSKDQTGLFYLGIDEYIQKPSSPLQVGLRGINLIRKYRAYKQVINQAAELKEAAHYDSLTRLYNRHGFNNISNISAARSKRHNEELGVLYIDLDDFKQANDMHGHESGDHVLIQFSGILKAQLRNHDIIARWGGDEFVVLLSHCSLEYMEKVSLRILDVIHSNKENLLGVGCSIGIAHGIVEDSLALNALIKHADEAMYEAKKRGKDTVLRY